VNAVEGIFLKQFGWIFRPQPYSDLGLDAHIEVSNEVTCNAKYIGVQIKTGDDCLHKGKKGLVLYTDSTHVSYWLSHAFPVLVVGHLPSSGKTYWQGINADTCVRTANGWKIELPYEQN